MDASSRVSPLRQRMIDDMRMRKLSEKTQTHYLRWVQRFAAYLGRSPDTATVEELRGYQLHLVDHGTSPVSLNAAITGLKFFFEVTLDQGELMAKMQPVRVPRTLPVVLSREEAARLIAAARNLKHQTALSVPYGTGLRASEVVALKVTDIDSQRMTLRVEQGKGRKDRYAMLSPLLLERLRTWWRVARAQGKMLDGGWLFPGMNPLDPMRCIPCDTALPPICWNRKSTSGSSRCCSVTRNWIPPPSLRPVVRGRRGDVAHHRRRPQASRRAGRRDAGPAHLGLGADAPSPCARHRAGRGPRRRRCALGLLQTGLLPAGARALAVVSPSLP